MYSGIFVTEINKKDMIILTDKYQLELTWEKVCVMETIIDSLSLDEQKKIDPELFTQCPSCKHEFKIPARDEITVGDWKVRKTVVFHDDEHIKLTPVQCHILYEIARSKSPVTRQTIGYRTSGINTEDVENIVSVQIFRIRKVLLELGIPCPIRTVYRLGYEWIRD